MPKQSNPRATLQSYKSRRKQRIIKNGLVKVDDVSTAPGFKNTNWLHIAKNKLKRRELVLLHKRQKILDGLITDAIHTFIDENIKRYNFNACMTIYRTQFRHKLLSPQSVIMRQSFQAISLILQSWKGYKPDIEQSQFRHYFQKCRHWFDTKKIRPMAVYFWIPIMIIIEEFVNETAIQCFRNQPRSRRMDVRTSHVNHLNVLILKSIFEGDIQLPNSRRITHVVDPCHGIWHLFKTIQSTIEHCCRGFETFNQEQRNPPSVFGMFMKAMAQFPAVVPYHHNARQAIQTRSTATSPFLSAECTVMTYPSLRNESRMNHVILPSFIPRVTISTSSNKRHVSDPTYFRYRSNSNNGCCRRCYTLI
eukprot:836982_1